MLFKTSTPFVDLVLPRTSARVDLGPERMRSSLRSIAGVYALACLWVVTGCSTIPTILGVDPEHLHFEKTELREGVLAPDFTLPLHHGQGAVTLSELRGKPVVLVFGSYT